MVIYCLLLSFNNTLNGKIELFWPSNTYQNGASNQLSNKYEIVFNFILKSNKLKNTTTKQI